MTAQEKQKPPQPTVLAPGLELAPRLDPPDPSDSEKLVVQSPPFGFRDIHSEFASFHEGYTRHYIALADTKAGVIFALIAGIIGYLLNKSEFLKIVLAPAWSIEFVIFALCIFALSSVAALTFLVVAPRLASSSAEGTVFFGAVAQRDRPEDYIRDIAASTEDDLTAARLKHCYDTAKVCARKYSLLKKAIWLTPPTLLLSLIVILTV